MSNIADALDCYLTAKVKIKEWADEFYSSWYEPVSRVMIGVMLKAAREAPPEIKREMTNNLSPAARRKLRGEK